MRTTLLGRGAPYLGVDLTDRYAKPPCRAIEVCGLTPIGTGALKSKFWHWYWDAAPMSVDLKPLLPELTVADIIVIDGPQALAFGGMRARACEQEVGAAAKTPGTRPLVGTRPYAGFICSSLDFFAALDGAGMLSVVAEPRGSACEVYPADVWKVLTGRHLPKKGARAGRMIRRRILEKLGVTNLPELPTHDQNDACLAAVIGAAIQGDVRGITCGTIGQPLTRDARGVLREGVMARPLVSCSIRASIVKLLKEAEYTASELRQMTCCIRAGPQLARSSYLSASLVLHLRARRSCAHILGHMAPSTAGITALGRKAIQHA